MAGKVAWTLTVDVPGGPKFSRSQIVDVEAYQQIQVTVPGATPGPEKAKISVMPAGSEAQFLLITSSLFHSSKLTYKPTGGKTDFALDSPHVIAGGAIGLLGQPENWKSPTPWAPARTRASRFWWAATPRPDPAGLAVTGRSACRQNRNRRAVRALGEPC